MKDLLSCNIFSSLFLTLLVWELIDVKSNLLFFLSFLSLYHRLLSYQCRSTPLFITFEEWLLLILSNKLVITAMIIVITMAATNDIWLLFFSIICIYHIFWSLLLCFFSFRCCLPSVQLTTWQAISLFDEMNEICFQNFSQIDN